MPRQRKIKKRPLGYATGMLVASAVTFWGIFAGFDPDVILVRALISALLTGISISCAMGLFHLVSDFESKTKRKLNR